MTVEVHFTGSVRAYLAHLRIRYWAERRLTRDPPVELEYIEVFLSLPRGLSSPTA